MPRGKQQILPPREQFDLFVQRADELARRRLIKDGLKVSFTIRYKDTDGLQVTPANVDEEDVRSFVLDLRHFLSDNEPVHLDRLFNLCLRYLKDDTIKGHVSDARKHWWQIQKQISFELTIDGQQMTPAHVADVLINGQYFHNDPDHRSELGCLSPMLRTTIDAHFLFFVVKATEVILYLANVIRHGLSKGLFAIDEAMTA